MEPLVLGLAVAAVLSLVWFLRTERRHPHPLLRLDYFRRPTFTAPLVANAANQFAYMGGFVVVPLLLGDRYGYGVGLVALLMAPRPGAFALCSPLGGIITTKVGEGIPGYVTPKVAVGAVVSNDEGEILLVQRADSGVWLYPTGWADVGYSPSEIALKEVEEETGIECEVLRPIAVLDGMRLGFTHVPLYSIVFHCRATGGTLRAHPLECQDVGWFPADALPEPLAGFEQWGRHVFAAIRGEAIEVLFDAPRTPPWRPPAADEGDRDG